MNNDVVMRKVADLLPTSCLRDLRVTSTLWNTNFIPQLKNKHEYIAFRKEDWCPKKLTELVEVMRSSTAIPFGRFCLDFVIWSPLNESVPLEHKQSDLGFLDFFLGFAMEFGNIITTLQLLCQRHDDISISQIRTLVFEYTPQLVELRLDIDGLGLVSPEEPEEGESTPKKRRPLRKLKLLKVDVVTTFGATVNPGFAQLVANVIQSATDLKELELFDSSASPTPENELGFEQGHLLGPALTALMGIQHITKLKFLKLPDVLTRVDLLDLLQVAATSGMKLDTFIGCVLCKKLPPSEIEEGKAEYSDLFRDFLTTQSPTLRKLKLIFEAGEGEELDSCTVPRLEHLKMLEIKDSTLRSDEIQFTDNPTGRFVDTFPALTALSIQNNYGPRLRAADVISRFAHPGLTSLIFCSKVSENVDASPLISIFASAFPSLTRLDLVLTLESGSATGFEGNKDVLLDAKLLGKIWSNWPALTSVRIQYLQFTTVDLDLDAFVSGVPRTGLERLRRNVGDQSKLQNATPASLAEMVKKFKTRPSMSDLEHLRIFEVTFVTSKDKHPQLTDLGGYFGVALAPPSLQRLVINEMAKNLISKECLEFIRAKMGPWAEIIL